MFKDLLKKSVLIILQWEARAVLSKYSPRIIAITGSVGKTTTKDAIYAALSSRYKAQKSQKSYNSELGVPLAILGQTSGWSSPLAWFSVLLSGLGLIVLKYDYPDWLVLEVGADHPGDIERITSWLKPDIAVVTRLSKTPVHVEFFDSPEDVAREKRFLVEALSQDGVAVLNHDDEDVLSFAKHTEGSIITYGFNAGARLTVSHIDYHYENERPAGMTFKVQSGGSSVPVLLRGVLGVQPIYAVLGALAAGTAAGLNLVEMGHAFEAFSSPPGRMKILGGVKDSLIIDDSYNASPVAVERALTTLAELQTTGRRIAVLGDMMELGKYSTEAHRAVGKQVTRVADIVITVGVRARTIAETALAEGMTEDQVFQFSASREAGKKLEHLLAQGDVVLVKGSQSSRMERAVEEVMAEPEKATTLLVRQEAEWKK